MKRTTALLTAALLALSLGVAPVAAAPVHTDRLGLGCCGS